MKKAKIAFSLLGLSSTLMITGLPLITSCSTSNNIRNNNNVNVNTPVKQNASLFMTSSNPINGQIYCETDDTYNTVKICAGPELFEESDFDCKDITFNEEVNIGGKTYTLIDIDDMAFNTLPDKKPRIVGTVKFNRSLKGIGKAAFANQDQVTKYDFSDLVTSTGIVLSEDAFRLNDNLETIVFGDNLTNLSIGKQTFYECVKLNDIHFPRGLTTLDNQAFEGCSGLTKVTFASEDKGAVENMTIGTDVFKNTSLKTVSVPKGMKDTYQAKLGSVLPEGCTIDDGYKPTPTPSENNT